MKRHVKTIVVSVLVLAFIAGAIVLLWQVQDPASSPDEPVADEGILATTPEGTQNPNAEPSESDPSPRTNREINIYAVERDPTLYRLVDAYAKKHWSYRCKINIIDSSTDYNPAEVLSMINQSLQSGDGAVDIYLVYDQYAPYYLQGEYSEYACTYRELGIDVESALKKAEIPEYAVGRNSDGEVMALPYFAGTSVFMYRRSIAREVWGTDDPDRISEIIGGGSRSWDKFLEAAKTLKKHGYYIAPGYKHLAWMIDTSASSAWDSGQKEIPPLWKEFMDVSRYMFEQGYILNSDGWSDAWCNDKESPGSRVFGAVVPPDYFEHAIRATPGDWAICMPPFPTWVAAYPGIMVNKASPNKDILGPLVEWITLDCSEEGAQYGLATGDLLGSKTSVLSGTVLRNAESRRDALGGQDVNPVIYNLLKQPLGKHDGMSIFNFLLDAMEGYVTGETDEDSVMRQFKDEVEQQSRS